MKSKQFRQIGKPTKSVTQYTLSLHALKRVRQRFITAKGIKELEYEMSLLIHNANLIMTEGDTKRYQMGKTVVVVNWITKTIITVINRLSDK